MANVYETPWWFTATDSTKPSSDFTSGSVLWCQDTSVIYVCRSGAAWDPAVYSGSIASGNIGWPHMASGAVRSGIIGNDAVVSGSMSSGSVYISGGFGIRVDQNTNNSFTVTAFSGSASVTSGVPLSGSVYGVNQGGYRVIASGSIGRLDLGSGYLTSGGVGNIVYTPNGMIVKDGQIVYFGDPNDLVVDFGTAIGISYAGEFNPLSIASYSNNPFLTQWLDSVNNMTISTGGGVSGFIISFNNSGMVAGDGVIAPGNIAAYHAGMVIKLTGTSGTNYITSGAMLSGAFACFGVDGLGNAPSLPNINFIGILSGGVTSGYIGNQAVVSGSYASGSIGAVHVSSGTVVGASPIIVSGNATNIQVGVISGAITNLQIAPGTVTGGTGGNIGTGTITPNNLAGGLGNVATGNTTSLTTSYSAIPIPSTLQGFLQIDNQNGSSLNIDWYISWTNGFGNNFTFGSAGSPNTLAPSFSWTTVWNIFGGITLAMNAPPWTNVVMMAKLATAGSATLYYTYA